MIACFSCTSTESNHGLSKPLGMRKFCENPIKNRVSESIQNKHTRSTGCTDTTSLILHLRGGFSIDGDTVHTSGGDREMMEEVRRALEGRDLDEVKESTALLVEKIKRNLDENGQLQVEIPGGSIPMYHEGSFLNVTDRGESPIPPPARFSSARTDAADK